MSTDLTHYAERPHILVVDDDERLRELIRRFLHEQGLVVATASHAAEAKQILANYVFDLMVLDVMMPGQSGVAFTKEMRAVDKSLPVLLLTARGEADDRISGLEAGADDYLPKPFEPRELLLRINAILRRVPKPLTQTGPIKLGPWLYDITRDELRQGDAVMKLTGMEANLLRIFAQDVGKPLTREQVAERSKGQVSDRTVDVQVTRLRRKIESDPKNPRLLVTVRGEGYMLIPDT